MSFFISDALAAAPEQQSGFEGPIMIVALFAIFYFMLIRPQSKRNKEHKNLISSLAKGDEVVTNGGILGSITSLDDNFVTVEIAGNVEVKFERQAISRVMPKGTIKGS